MAVYTKKVEALTEHLIETVTDFKPEDENYTICCQFCRSIIKFHRYLDINSSHVTRTIQNVVTKFNVHSLPERAHQLSSLVQNFLTLGPLPESDLHYKILHFLLESSVSPTNADYSLPDHLEPLVVKQQQDKFDWASYLMEGIEMRSFCDSTSEEMSSLSEVESSSDDDDHGDKECTFDSQQTLKGTKPIARMEQYWLSLSWLRDHVTSVYWDDCSPHHTTGSSKAVGHPSCNLIMDSGGRAGGVSVVSEVQVVRETLWMLMGVVGGCAYNEEDLSVNGNIGISHTSLLSLHKILNEFSLLGVQLKAIRQKISESVDPKGTTTQVVQASMHFIQNYINKFNCLLRDLEKNISKRENFVSLLSLKKQLNFYKKEVFCVFSVLENVTDQKSILDILWMHLDHHDSLSDRQCMGIVLPWLLASLRPYMEILNKWLTEGKLDDPHLEFFVIRNATKAKSWTEGFSLSSHQPLCIQPLVEKIFIAGKSWCYIESLDKKNSNSPASCSLYEEFLSMLNNACSSSDEGSDGTSSDLTVECSAAKGGDLVVHPPPNLVMLGMNSTISSYLMESQSDYHKVLCSRDNVHDTSAKIEHCSVLSKMIAESIRQCIEPRYSKATSSLTNILKTEYRLLEHFNSARQFFLMEAGHIMHMFSNLLFEKMTSGTVWLDQSFLNSILEESLQEQYTKYEDVLTIEVDEAVPAVVSLESLAAVSLHYKVDWPIDIFFPRSITDTYNQIFSFLLQVKFAKWCLIQLAIGKYRGHGEHYSAKVHRLFLFRAKLLHFVNSLNNYLLTRILHSSGIEFQESVSKANDLDSIILLHTNYVNQIHDRCLLNKKANLVKEAIFRTLQLTLTLYNLWNKGMKDFNWFDGNRIEKDFNRCIQFLLSCLNKHIKRGSFPHLETLLFALSSLLSGPKYFQ